MRKIVLAKLQSVFKLKRKIKTEIKLQITPKRFSPTQHCHDWLISKTGLFTNNLQCKIKYYDGSFLKTGPFLNSTNFMVLVYKANNGSV